MSLYHHNVLLYIPGLRDITFSVYGEKLAPLLGSRTPRAMQWFKNCSDTHQAWESTLVEMGTLGRELMVKFGKDCLSSGMPLEQISLDKFLNDYIVKQTKKSPNYKFCFDVLTHYYMAIKLFDIGIHRNHMDYIQTGLDYFRDVWHSRNHPIYRCLIEILEHKKNYLPDSDVKTFILKSQSLLTSDNLTTGQAPDFRLEESNAGAQHQLPPGIPSKDVWLRIYRHWEGLQENRKAWFENVGLKDPKLHEYTKLRCEENLLKEIHSFQILFRKYKYFEDSEEHKSLAGKVLHPKLKDFVKLSKKIRQQNLQVVCEKKSLLELSKTESFLYIDTYEESKKKNRTMKDMNQKIETTINSIPDPDLREKWLRLWSPYKEINTKESSSKFLEKLENNDDGI